MLIGEIPPPQGAFGIDAIAMTMRFGDFVALDNVELKVKPGTLHALLGENGAGKSTLVKCIMGYYHATEGQIMVGERQSEGCPCFGTRHGLPAFHAGAGDDGR